MCMDLQGLIIFIPLLLVAMTVHEASHALMSYILGDHTAKWEGRLTLNPLAHIDPVFTVLIPAIMIALGYPPILAAKPVPFDPHKVKFGEYGAALVAVAGPLSNIILAVLAGGWLHFMMPGLGYEIVEFFLRLNVSLAIFNLVPWPPLDGSRVLYAFAPEPVQRIMRQIEGFGIAGLFVFIFVAWSFISPLVTSVQSWIINLLV
jgi:Zn-dependent protease